MARWTTPGSLHVPHPAGSAPVATLAPSAVPGVHLSTKSRWEALLGPNTLLGRAVRAPLWVAMMGIPGGGVSLSLPQSADKTWWPAESGDQKPQRGMHRWYIEKTRDGFRVTQLQQWNGSDWRTLKLKGEPIPPALQEKLSGLNSVVSVPSRAATLMPAHPIAPALAQHAPSSNIVSPDIVDANMDRLSKLPDGQYPITLNLAGKVVSTEGVLDYPYVLSIRCDPDTGLRQWMVVDKKVTSLPINFGRAIEKLNEPAEEAAQLVQAIDSFDVSFSRTLSVTRTDHWFVFQRSHRGRFTEGQLGYEVLFSEPTHVGDGAPLRWQMGKTAVYTVRHGWQNMDIWQDPPQALVTAIKVVNARLARNVEARQQLAIHADAATIAQALSGPPLEQSFMLDFTGRMDGKKGCHYKVSLRWNQDRLLADTMRVTAYESDGVTKRWDVRSEGVGWRALSADGRPFRLFMLNLPPDFPVRAFREILEAVRQKMTAR